MVSPQEGKVVQRRLCCPNHLAHVLDGKPRPCLVGKQLDPLISIAAASSRLVEYIGVGVVEGDDDGSLLELRRVAVEL